MNQVDFQVPTGSFYGLVGPNGAGKSTLLDICTGLLKPDHGQVLVNGADMWHNPAQAKLALGVLPDGMHMFDLLSGFDHLTYVALLRGLDRETARQRADSLLKAFDLPTDKKSISEYSTGMRKKLGLALALVTSPRLVVLDEPFEAVDPVSADTLQMVLKKFVASGGTIVLSSHVMATIEQLCTHVGVISKGRMLAQGSTQEVAGSKTLNERFFELVGHTQTEQEGLSWLGQ